MSLRQVQILLGPPHIVYDALGVSTSLFVESEAITCKTIACCKLGFLSVEQGVDCDWVNCIGIIYENSKNIVI